MSPVCDSGECKPFPLSVALQKCSEVAFISELDVAINAAIHAAGFAVCLKKITIDEP